MINKVQKMSYEERLRKLKLPMLKYRRLRGDMIETFKLVHGIYDQSASLKLNFSAALCTHGNGYKIDKKHLHYDVSKYFFRNRIISVWNNLPEAEDMVTIGYVNSFRHSLDKF